MNRKAALVLLALLAIPGLLAGCKRGDPNHAALAHVRAIAANKEGAVEAARAELANADDIAVLSIALALRDEDVYKRAAACQALGATRNRAAAAHLIGALNDAVAFVRRLADRALMDISGKDMKFVAMDPPKRRAEAVARWKAWSRAR